MYFQNIRDDMKDILAELLQLEGALPRYNPRILEKPSSPDRYSTFPSVQENCMLLCMHKLVAQ